MGNFDESDESAYGKARKLGIKAYHTAIQNGSDPYLPVLDDLVPNLLALAPVNLGLISIPIERVAGTGTRGRTNAFANNFMPILDRRSEFANKWMMLNHSVVESGVREPVKALEYLNKYYILEGNKRISVMKFNGAVFAEAEVTRIMPKRTDEKENRIYFEYLDFYRDTQINYLWFSEPGGFAKLTELVGCTPGVAWTDEQKADFQAAYYRFSSAFNLIGGDLMNLTPGDAMLIYLQIYGYSKEAFLNSAKIHDRLMRLRNEFRTQAEDESYALRLNDEGEEPGLLRKLIHPAPQQLRVAFVNNHSPQTSGWTYWHELGKNRVETVFGSGIQTQMVSDVDASECEQTVEKLISDGANIVFTTSPVLLDGAVKSALRHPEVKVLNCSLLPSYHAVRSYYLRIYEAKFIIGAIAGAMCDNNRIGYVADYPVFGTPASINAFALGARLTNPRAEVWLEWSTLQDGDPEKTFRDNRVQVVSNRDISAPSHRSLDFGLYVNDGSTTRNLAMPVWNWGRLYEDLLGRVRSGIWSTDGEAHATQALNYWWGMDTGAVDVFYSNKLDAGLRRMIDLLRRSVREETLYPFAEQIRDQNGELRCAPGGRLTPAQIIAMDYLAENVHGVIPAAADLRPEARAFVALQGVRDTKAPDTSEICWTEPIGKEEAP